MIARLVRVAAIACGLACGVASPAAAGDWLLTPFIGTTFAPATNLTALETNAGSNKLVVGASGGILGSGVLGVEANASYALHFFQGINPLGTTIQHSAVGTLMGDVLIAVPTSITHESLRPYAVAGAGLMHATIEDIRGALPVDRNLTGMEWGGGAIGFVNRRAGFRFDVRRLSSLTREPSILPKGGGSQLSFWRVALGVVVKY